jgi:hypothetical protein
VGRPKPAPKPKKLPNRLKGETDVKDDGFLPDGNGGSLAPVRIKELEDAAEAHRGLRERIADLKEKLDGEVYARLRDAYDKHREELGPAGVYRYEDANGDIREVAKDADPKVSVRKPKKEKKVEANGIVSGGDVDDLEDEEEKDE